MEIRIIILFLLILIYFAPVAKGTNEILTPNSQIQQDSSVDKSSLVTPQKIDFSKCCTSFDMSTEKLFYLAISALNANNFEIEEIQSKMGYILFRAANKSFLASISKENNQSSMLKITPADNVYFFPYGVIYNVFYYIDLNKSEPLEQI